MRGIKVGVQGSGKYILVFLKTPRSNSFNQARNTRENSVPPMSMSAYIREHGSPVYSPSKLNGFENQQEQLSIPIFF
jgi:hypothetical protein